MRADATERSVPARFALDIEDIRAGEHRLIASAEQ
jgi:hypothetical protein